MALQKIYLTYIARINKENLKDESKVNKFGCLTKLRKLLCDKFSENPNSFIKKFGYAYMATGVHDDNKQELYAYFEYRYDKNDRHRWALTNIKTKQEINDLCFHGTSSSLIEKIEKPVLDNSDFISNTYKENEITQQKKIKVVDKKNSLSELSKTNQNNKDSINQIDATDNIILNDLSIDIEEDDDRRPRQNIMQNFEIDNKHEIPVIRYTVNELDNTFLYVEMVNVPGNEEIKSFYISKYVIVQKLYKDIMGEEPSYFKTGNPEKLPVENVTWEKAIEFCNKLSEREGLAPSYLLEDGKWKIDTTANGYRLPTREEWLLAACDGQCPGKYKYSGSNSEHSVAWYRGNTPEQTTHEVGEKKANKLGIYDMSGNVWEWCWGADEHDNHFCCGGAFNSNIDTIELNNSRNIKNVSPLVSDKAIGFRVIKSSKGE